MKKRTGLYPTAGVDAAACGGVSQAGGGVALLETARVSGLDRQLSRSLEPWCAPRAVHDPIKVLMDLAVTLALGGDCLADIAVLRSEPGVYGRVASDPTVSGTIDALAADAPRAQAAINSARATARAAVWELAGTHAPDHEASAEQPLVVDIGATLVTSHSEKEEELCRRPSNGGTPSPNLWRTGLNTGQRGLHLDLRLGAAGSHERF